jgi:hypothetical protein
LTSKKLPKKQQPERRLEKELERLEEDVSRRAFFQKLGHNLKTMFARHGGERANG